MPSTIRQSGGKSLLKKRGEKPGSGGGTPTTVTGFSSTAIFFRSSASIFCTTFTKSWKPSFFTRIWCCLPAVTLNSALLLPLVLSFGESSTRTSASSGKFSRMIVAYSSLTRLVFSGGDCTEAGCVRIGVTGLVVPVSAGPLDCQMSNQTPTEITTMCASTPTMASFIFRLFDRFLAPAPFETCATDGKPAPGSLDKTSPAGSALAVSALVLVSGSGSRSSTELPQPRHGTTEPAR